MLSLPENTRMCLFNNDAVFLDIIKDEYFIIENGAGIFRKNTKDPEIFSLAESGLQIRLIPDLQVTAENGFFEIRWMMPEFNKRGVSTLSKLLFFIRTRRFIRMIDRKGMAGIVSTISSARMKETALSGIPDESVSNELNALISGVMLFKKGENPCLIYSFLMTLGLLERGFDAKLVVGVRTEPFYSHAWVEIGDHIPFDDPCLREKLSVILEV